MFCWDQEFIIFKLSLKYECVTFINNDTFYESYGLLIFAMHSHTWPEIINLFI